MSNPSTPEPDTPLPAHATDETSAQGSAPSGPPLETAGRGVWRRLLRIASPRATKANVLVTVLAVLLGVGIATQVQLTQERGLSELSQSDLIRVLDDVSVRSSRLDAQLRELEATRDRLKSGIDTTGEALAQAKKRYDTLGILAGTLGAEGPGITMTITDPRHAVSAPIVLDLIQELRDAGAEAIEVGGVRVVASSFVVDGKRGLLIDGTAVKRPTLVKAIGDATTLSSAMAIPGGIIETVRQKGASATVKELERIKITSVHQPRPMPHVTMAE
ncbi:MAG: DUF881 domain-containing protein [Micrococcales bacterium]|nr:DUF881 domain-containing protein [Micrococcales bacterium]